jgi:hypothetical protein
MSRCIEQDYPELHDELFAIIPPTPTPMRMPSIVYPMPTEHPSNMPGFGAGLLAVGNQYEYNNNAMAGKEKGTLQSGSALLGEKNENTEADVDDILVFKNANFNHNHVAIPFHLPRHSTTKKGASYAASKLGRTVKKWFTTSSKNKLTVTKDLETEYAKFCHKDFIEINKWNLCELVVFALVHTFLDYQSYCTAVGIKKSGT